MKIWWVVSDKRKTMALVIFTLYMDICGQNWTNIFIIISKKDLALKPIPAHFRESETFVDFRAKNSCFIRPRKQVFKSSVCYLVLEKYFQNKNCEAFLSVHEWAHDLYQTCYKRDPNVTPKCRKRDQTKYCIKRNPDDRISYEVYEIVCKYVVHHQCIAQYKFP